MNRVGVTKAVGTCTADPPMMPGDPFTVRDGDIRIPASGYVCLQALHSLMPRLLPKQRAPADGDWMKGADHGICPDPAGNVIMRIETL